MSWGRGHQRLGLTARIVSERHKPNVISDDQHLDNISRGEDEVKVLYHLFVLDSLVSSHSFHMSHSAWEQVMGFLLNLKLDIFSIPSRTHWVHHTKERS